MRDLNNYLCWSEITNVLCTVFAHGEAEAAVNTVKRLRSREWRIEETSPPVQTTRGAFYNSINQVPNHASLGYLLFDKTNETSLYDPTRQERRHEIRSEWHYLIDLALGGSVAGGVCELASSFIARMPRAPEFADEAEHFEYAGAPVEAMPDYTSAAARELRTMRYGQGTVVILGQMRDYHVREGDSITGPIGSMCLLERGQRVILEEDMYRTYLVMDKERTRHGEIRVSLRAARPITDPKVMEQFVEPKNG
jgi:hypothetical protein